jgi:hypothetical protein
LSNFAPAGRESIVIRSVHLLDNLLLKIADYAQSSFGHGYFSTEKFLDPDSLVFTRSVSELLHVFAIQPYTEVRLVLSRRKPKKVKAPFGALNFLAPNLGQCSESYFRRYATKNSHFARARVSD